MQEPENLLILEKFSAFKKELLIAWFFQKIKIVKNYKNFFKFFSKKFNNIVFFINFQNKIIYCRNFVGNSEKINNNLKRGRVIAEKKSEFKNSGD